MRQHPVLFICPACGVDASQFVDSLVRRELGQTSAPSGTPVSAIELAAAPEGVMLESAEPPVPSVRLNRTPVPDAAVATAVAGGASARCARHPGELAAAKCYICSKPICPKCMDLFGYVCSPLCKAKADSHGIHVPVYEAQKSRVDARRWRKLVWAATSGAGVIVLLLGIWSWYAFFGCRPKPIFSVRFSEPAYSGQSALGGNQRDQLVFLHGPILARYDLKSGKEIWSRRIVNQQKIDQAVAMEQQATQKLINKANSEAWENVPKMPSAQKLARAMERDATAALNLYVRGQSIWVTSPEQVVQYDWQTGKPGKEFPVQAGRDEVLGRGNELLLVSAASSPPTVTYVDLGTGTARKEDLGKDEGKALAENTGRNAGASTSAATASGISLPTGSPMSGTGKPMDPSKVAAQAQRLSLPEKLALPAVLAGNMNQQRALNEMDDSTHDSAATQAAIETSAGFSLVPSKDGFVEFGVRLLESRIVARSAMKPGSGKSALEGDVTAGKSMDLSNEMLNEMQRENGGDLVREDHSRYQVTVRRPGSESAWTGEVVGPPKLYPLESVNVIAADKLIIVLDKANRKLWQSALGFNVVPGVAGLDEESATYGQGPCVERKATLYVFDLGVLSAFDLKNGDARWRLPTVGIVGLFFDDHDMVYVNTTSASHESLKYSRQIDLSQKVSSVILKLDSHDGKILWNVQSRGLVNYVSGRFILSAQSSVPDDDDPDSESESVHWMRIRRLNPSSGQEVWDDFQQRAPLDIAFDQNTIRLVFKKEVQILRFPRL
jgi:hypothetical protein